jgi:hypothetical protein
MALLVCAAAAAVTAAAAGPRVVKLDISPGTGVSGSPVTLTPHVGTGPTCSLAIDGTEVKTGFPCGIGADKVNFLSTTYKITGDPGPHKVLVCQPGCTAARTVARTTFEVLAVVPDLTGQSRAQAQNVLKKAFLTFGGATTGSSADAGARVTGQSPSPGSAVSSGFRVVVELRLPPPPPPPPTIPVPDVRQYALEDAQKILADQGFTPRPSAPAGTVVDQKPSPGSRVAPGSPVDLTVQSPPPPTQPPTPPPPPPAPSPPYAAIGAALLVLILAIVGVSLGAARVVRTFRQRRRPGRTPPPAPAVDVRFVAPHDVAANALATSAKPGLDVNLRLTSHVSTTSEGRTS